MLAPSRPFDCFLIAPNTTGARKPSNLLMAVSFTPVKRESTLPIWPAAPPPRSELATYSSGMTHKVGLAQAVINEPRLLLLDEPTSGLDPIGRQEFLEPIRSLSTEHGVTTMFSTHILSNIERLCERVAVLHQGKLIASGNLSALKERHGVREMDELYISLVQTTQ